MIERIGDRMSGRSWAVPLSGVAIGAILLRRRGRRRGLGRRARVVRGARAPRRPPGVGGRFEAVRQARGEGGDERDQMIDSRAMAFAGIVLVVALTGAVLAELVQGDSALPYVPILAVGGAAYVVAWAWLRWRS